MHDITVFTKSGLTLTWFGEATLDPIENSLVIHPEVGGIVRYYWPNVDFFSEMEPAIRDLDE
jgi:hypothetical protein